MVLNYRCLQERALAPRILHFGSEQLHWECSEGLWSEDSTKRKNHGNFSHDDAGDIRRALSSHPEEYSSKRSNTVHGRPPYGRWYSIVMTYTSRQITYPGDKLPALSAVARRFATLCKDDYTAGLWIKDLAYGLLWSSYELHASLGVSTPPICRDQNQMAPSWSWASIKGPVQYPHDELDDPLLFDLSVSGWLIGKDRFGPTEHFTLKVTGFVMLLESTIGFRKVDEEWIEEYRRKIAAPDLVRQCFDDKDSVTEDPIHCLLIATRGIEDRFGLGYGILLQKDEDSGSFRRVGMARVAVKSFAEAEMSTILII